MTGDSVRSSSSTQPASEQRPVQRGSALALHERRWVDDAVEPPQRLGHVDSAEARPHLVERTRRTNGRRRAVGGEDEEPGAAREQLARRIDIGSRRDDADALAGLARRAVPLGAYGAGADEDEVGRSAQRGEHRAVGLVAERARCSVDDRGAVEAGDHAHADPRAVADPHPWQPVQLVERGVARWLRVDDAHEWMLPRPVATVRMRRPRHGCVNGVLPTRKFTGLSPYRPTGAGV